MTTSSVIQRLFDTDDAIEHARVFVQEIFDGNVRIATEIALLNVETDPDRADYWHRVASACGDWGRRTGQA